MATQIRGGLTRLQVGTAACAVVAAAALPAVAANAEPIVPAPTAPVTDFLIDAPFAPLSPVMNIAEQPWWLENNRIDIDSFGALFFEVVERIDGSPFLKAILPPYTDIGRVIVDAILVRIGPYGAVG